MIYELQGSRLEDFVRALHESIPSVLTSTSSQLEYVGVGYSRKQSANFCAYEVDFWDPVNRRIRRVIPMRVVKRSDPKYTERVPKEISFS